MKIDDDILVPKRNNITFVRLVLASAVIYSHALEFKNGWTDPSRLTYYLGKPIAHYAVDCFFILSGFLVYPSLLRLRSVGWFLAARLARLWPGLVVAVLLTVAGGYFVTSDRAHYLTGATARFLVGNISLLKGAYWLTGLQCGAQLCNIDPSLWTLPIEFRCYILLAGLSLVGCAEPKVLVYAILPLTLIFWFSWDYPPLVAFVEKTFGYSIMYIIGIMARLWPLFMLGVAAYILRHRVVLAWPIFLLLLALDLLTAQQPFAPQTRGLFEVYLVLCMGLLTARQRSFSGNWPDYSYGIYIYAGPMMFVADKFLPTASHYLLSAGTFILTLPLAIASWHGVEKPAMALMKRIRSVSRSPRQEAGVVAPS